MKKLRLYVETDSRSKLSESHVKMFQGLEKGVKGLKVKLIYVPFRKFEGGCLTRISADSEN
jgi:hypothetical protein